MWRIVSNSESISQWQEFAQQFHCVLSLIISKILDDKVLEADGKFNGRLNRLPSSKPQRVLNPTSAKPLCFIDFADVLIAAKGAEYGLQQHADRRMGPRYSQSNLLR